MATPEEQTCADIERHLKALLMPGSSPTTSHTPPKRGQQNKKYEEDFPALAPGMSCIPLVHDIRNDSMPPKPLPAKVIPGNYVNTPPGRNDSRTPRYNRNDGYRDARQMNGFDYFKGKEVVNLKPTHRMVQHQEDARSPKNSFSEIGATGMAKASQGGKELQEPIVNCVPPTQDIIKEEGFLKQKKRMKKKDRREATAYQDSSNSVLSKLTVNNRPAGFQDTGGSSQGQLTERKEIMRKNKTYKSEKPTRCMEDDNPHQRLRNEIIREKQQRTNEMERRSYEQEELQFRLSQLDREFLKYLESEFLYPLKKPSNRFPEALFLCQLCNYHCDMDNFMKHIKQPNHISGREMRRAEALLLQLPYPADSQCLVITKLLDRIYEEHGLNADDLRKRQELVEKLNQILQAKELLECKLQMYGSSVSGFGTKDSNLNLDLIFPSMDVLPVILSKLQQILNEEEGLSEVSTDYDAKMPKIFFKDAGTGLDCDITWSNIGTVHTSRLLGRYHSLDPRVPILGVAFKLWAKLCGVDRQEKGTLPPHCFAIMLIYFLQQHKLAVLPVLQEVEPNMDPTNPPSEGKLDIQEVPEQNGKWKCHNNQSTGELWIELLRFYGVTFKAVEHVVCIRFKKKVTRAEKKWDGKVTAIEDPYCRKRNLSRSIPNQLVFRFILERLRDAYKYFGIPQLLSKKGPLFVSLSPEVLKMSRKGRVLLESSPESSDVSEPENEGESGTHERRKTRGTAKGAVKGEDDGKEPVFDGHDTSSSDEDLLEDLDPDLNLDDLAIIPRLDLGGESNDDLKCRTESESSEQAAPVGDIALQKTTSSSEVSTAGQSAPGKATSKSPEKSVKKRPTSPPCQFIIQLMSSFSESDLHYTFDKELLSGGKSPPLFCGMCGHEGHWKDDCPTQILPPLVDLPELSPSYLQQLDAACHQVMCDKAPSEEEIEDRQKLLVELEEHIKKCYPDASLELFGSSCNGFVFTGSDLDICLTFTDKTGESFDHAEVIDRLAIHLRSHNRLLNILPITTAKVPIVKFNHKKHNVECDISLYNTLAQHNTRMLRAYCEIDKRVQVLGYTMKHFAKLCDIRDASRGSLSSYAYILMVLYFLQQRNPPIIPVLQELYDKSEPPEVTVDGWNAWFYDNIDDLSKMWPERGSNKESVGELWVGLLRFYTEQFNFKEHVVCIRQKALLTHFEKFWNAKMICIEDPFDLNHNLGVGVSRKMSIYIRKALIRGRELFGTPYETISRHHSNLNNFLFDSRKLMVEPPPNDRGCRACGKIGHKVKDCPNKRNSRQQNQQPIQRRQEQQQLHQQMQQQSINEKLRAVMRNNNHQNQKQENNRGNRAEAIPKNPRQALFYDTIQRHLHLNAPPMAQHLQYSQQQQHHHQQHHQQQHKQQQQQHRGVHQQGPVSNKQAPNIQHHPHPQQHQQGSPNQNRGGNSSFNESNSSDRGPFGGPQTLPLGIHPLKQLNMPSPSTGWPPNPLLPNMSLKSLPQVPVLPPSPTDRPIRMENSNTTPQKPQQQQQPISPPQHAMAFFQNQGCYPISFMSSPSTMGTPPSMHMFPQNASANSKQPGREDPPMMICRPPAPPPFPHPVWMMNSPSYSPFAANLSPNSPIRPNMGGSQLVGSPQALLGTSPQRGNVMPPSQASQFQHMPLLPEHSASNNNRTLPE